MNRRLLPLLLVAAACLLAGCPKREQGFRAPPALSGLNRPAFEQSVERWFTGLPEEDAVAVARCLLFVRDGDPKAALDHPDPRKAILMAEYPADLRIRLDGVGPTQIVARARRHLRELTAEAAAQYRDLEARTTELEDTRRRLVSSQAELTAMIEPGSISLVELPGLPGVRLRFTAVNLLGVPLSSFVLSVSSRSPDGRMLVREETSAILNPPIQPGERREVTRVLEKVPADGGRTPPEVVILNAFDVSQRPSVLAPDAGLDGRLAKLRTEVAEVAARLALYNAASRHPYLNHVMTWQRGAAVAP